jgi:hypothetical protein
MWVLLVPPVLKYLLGSTWVVLLVLWPAFMTLAYKITWGKVKREKH